MKLTPGDTYLALVVEALDNTLLPELQSSDARATAQVMRAILNELRRRENDGPRQLREHIATGRALAVRMAGLLGDTCPHDVPAFDTDTAFATLAAAYATLLADITALAQRLIARRGQDAGAAADAIGSLLHAAATWERSCYEEMASAPAPPPPPSAPKPPGAPLTREAFAAFMHEHHPDGARCRIVAFERIPGGFSKQTFRAVVRDARGTEQPLIIRKDAPVLSLAYGTFSVAHEFDLLRDVHAAGLPVAQPLYLGAGVPGLDSDFYVMSTLPGSLAGSFLGGAQVAVGDTLILGIAAFLARLHALPLQAFARYFAAHPDVAAATVSVESCYRFQLAQARDYQARVEFPPSPYLVFLFDWLERNVPRDTAPPVLVHGDCYIHNLLVQGDDITGVLDWECANFGVPEQDLAWIMPLISRHMEWQRFLDHYHACGGRRVDADTLRFCTAFNAARTTLSASKNHLNAQQGVGGSISSTMMELGFLLALMAPVED